MERILDLIAECKDPFFHIALSGGKTPARLFEVWATDYKEQTPWQRLRLYWVDERCVHPDDIDSNYGMTRRYLLDRVPLTPEQIFRIAGENDPQAEAVRYAQLVKEHVPLEGNMPVFNLVLLGAGSDGHTSSIFPDQAELLTTQQVYAVAHHPGTLQQRIALTGQPIIHAQNVIFLMKGIDKQPVLKAMQDSSDSGPAVYIAHHALHNVDIFADEAAAEAHTGQRKG